MKNAEQFIEVFQHAAAYLDKKQLKKMEIEFSVGEVLNSVYLKMYKRSWATPNEDPLKAKSRIFFSVWLNDMTISKQRIYYNIHALKLRQFPGYAIESRKFAALFRKDFKAFQDQWENVNVQFGPQTLMEGWLVIDPEHFQHVIGELGNRFFEIAPLIDHTLAQFKK